MKNKKNEPLVSILTASRKTGSYINDCISSVLAQDYKNIEMIIVDDYSNDRSSHFAKKHADKNHNITYCKEEKQVFCGSAYWRASTMARGSIICVLDGDDTLLPNSVSTIVDAYTKNPSVDFIYTQHYVCNKKLLKIKTGISSMPVEGNNIRDSWFKLRHHTYSHWRTCRSHMLKHDLFKQKLRFSVDKYMGMKLELFGQGAFLDTPLYNYRLHTTQITLSMRMQRKKVNTKLVKEIENIQIEKNIKLKPIIKL